MTKLQKARGARRGLRDAPSRGPKLLLVAARMCYRRAPVVVAPETET